MDTRGHQMTIDQLRDEVVNLTDVANSLERRLAEKDRNARNLAQEMHGHRKEARRLRERNEDLEAEVQRLRDRLENSERLSRELYRRITGAASALHGIPDE